MILREQYTKISIVWYTSLAKDQTEINRIILEASKGSKFFEVRICQWPWIWYCLTAPYLCQNEKKKDEELTVRIEKILKQRDEAVKGADLGEAFLSSMF